MKFLILVLLLSYGNLSHALKVNSGVSRIRGLAESTQVDLKNGKILIFGGATFENSTVESCTAKSDSYLFNTRTHQFYPAASLKHPRRKAEAVLLLDGRVLVFGGYSKCRFVEKVEVYDPKSNTWSDAGAIDYFNLLYTNVLLKDGRVLVTGSDEPVRPESAPYYYTVFDPKMNTWSKTNSVKDLRGYGDWRAPVNQYESPIILKNGEVFIHYLMDFGILYNPLLDSWKYAVRNLEMYPGSHVKLSNDNILTVGQSSYGIYSPRNDSWINYSHDTLEPQLRRCSLLLKNGNVLSLIEESRSYKFSQMYDPKRDFWTANSSLNERRSITNDYAECMFAMLGDGKVLLQQFLSLPQMETRSVFYLFNPRTNTWKIAGESSIINKFGYESTKLISLDNGEALTFELDASGLWTWIHFKS